MVEVDPTKDLDGPVAAPDHHRVLFENDRVRVLQTLVPVGEIAPVHTHLTPHLLIVDSGSHFVRRDPTGAVMLDTRAADPPFVMPPYSVSDGVPIHTLENTGTDVIAVIAIELKPQP